SARSNTTRLFGRWSRPSLIRNRLAIFKNASQAFENNDVNAICPLRFHRNGQINSRINRLVTNRPESLCLYSGVGASPQRKKHSVESPVVSRAGAVVSSAASRVEVSSVEPPAALRRARSARPNAKRKL